MGGGACEGRRPARKGEGKIRREEESSPRVRKRGRQPAELEAEGDDGALAAGDVGGGAVKDRDDRRGNMGVRRVPGEKWWRPGNGLALRC